MEETFAECIEKYKADNRTVLLSSHILSEAEKLCDRVVIIKSGNVVMDDTVANVRNKHGEGESLEEAFLKEYNA
jgi:ABC-2 type transport system ATP-binding protein